MHNATHVYDTRRHRECADDDALGCSASEPVSRPPSSPGGVRVRHHSRTGVTAVSLCGEHDMTTFELVASAFDAAIELGGSVQLDLSRVTFMDASTIRALVGLRAALPRSRQLTLRAVSRCAERLLTLCDLHEVLESTRPSPLVVSDDRRTGIAF